MTKHPSSRDQRLAAARQHKLVNNEEKRSQPATPQPAAQRAQARTSSIWRRRYVEQLKTQETQDDLRDYRS